MILCASISEPVRPITGSLPSNQTTCVRNYLVPGSTVYQRADTQPLHALLEKILTDDPTPAGSLAGDLFVLAMYERDFAAAHRAVSTLSEDRPHILQ